MAVYEVIKFYEMNGKIALNNMGKVKREAVALIIGRLMPQLLFFASVIEMKSDCATFHVLAIAN